MVVQVLISLSLLPSIVSRQWQLSSRSDWRLWVDAANARNADIIIIIIIILFYFILFILFFCIIFLIKNVKVKSNLEWLTFGVIPIDEGASESNLIETLA